MDAALASIAQYTSRYGIGAGYDCDHYQQRRVGYGECGRYLHGVVGGCQQALVMLKFKLSPRRILRQFGARPLSAHVAPGLNDLIDSLAQRAGLAAVPTLYYIPSATVNAFAVGTGHASAIAITDAMLRIFSRREIAAVFAHEVSHLRINDLWVMASSDLFNRLTRLVSTAGLLLLLLNLPLAFTSYRVSWAAILILVFMPLISALIHLTLSRTREYNADLGAVELTGDPRGLVMALEKMERYHRRSLRRILRPQGWLSKLSLLQTHPLTERRIERLRRLEPAMSRPLRDVRCALMLALQSGRRTPSLNGKSVSGVDCYFSDKSQQVKK